MIMNKDNLFNEGYEYFRNQLAGYLGSETLDASYLKNIQYEIDKLTEAINIYEGDGNLNLHGFIAEVWHVHTFNIDAVAKNTGEYVSRLDSNKLGSVDIASSWAEDYGLKYYQSGNKSAIAQSKSVEEHYRKFISGKDNPPTKEEYLISNGLDPNTDMDLSLYEGQTRLIPSDQINDAVIALKNKIAHDSCIPERHHLVAKYQETLNKLTDHIESSKGASSMRLTYDDSKTLASLGKEGNFDPQKYDITIAKKADGFVVFQNALEAGLHAMWISALLKATPHIMKAFKKLKDDGYITEDELRSIKKGTFSGAKDGLISGSLSAIITSISQMGYLGDSLKNISLSKSNNFASVLAIVVVLIKESVCLSIQLVSGKITYRDFCYEMEKTGFVAICGCLGAITMQSFIQIPYISCMLGNMIGTILGGLLFNVKEQLFLSLCVKNGYTFWGLVEQDYEMPIEIQKKLGYDTYDYDAFDYDSFGYDTFEHDSLKYDSFEYDKLDIVMLKRGVIGVRKIGYSN